MATHASHYIKTVSLKDWWLTKAENNSLHNTVAVAGIESTGQAARVFFSAPIVNRLGFCTLKTADGIFVLLRSLINKEQTCENGFSEEVFKYFSIGFPSNWEYCAEKCLQRGIGSKATADADLNPDEAHEATSELQDEQNIDSVEERKDLDSNNTHECFTAEGQVAASELQNDQNIDSVEDKKALDSNNMHEHFTAEAQEANIELQDAENIELVEGARYSLRNREVPYFEAKGACKGKHVRNLAKSKSFSKKTTISADISTIPSVASLENSQTPGVTPLCDESPKENAEHPNFVVSGGLNDANNPESISAKRPISLSGEPLTIDKSMHRIKKSQKSHKGDDMVPIHQDASKANSVISHHSFVGKSCESKKRKRIERRTSKKNIVRTRSLLKKTGERTDAFATTLVTVLPAQGNSPRPTPGSCTSKAKSNSKAAAPGIEGKSSIGSTSMLQTRRKLDYAEKITCTAEKENKTPTSQSSVIRTSRSGRLLLPPMEFWRNQLPIYDADHGISGIKEGLTTLKLNRG